MIYVLYQDQELFAASEEEETFRLFLIQWLEYKLLDPKKYTYTIKTLKEKKFYKKSSYNTRYLLEEIGGVFLRSCDLEEFRVEIQEMDLLFEYQKNHLERLGKSQLLKKKEREWVRKCIKIQEKEYAHSIFSYLIQQLHKQNR